jgi:hypothetical protein
VLTGIDHSVIVVRDLEHAVAGYTALGRWLDQETAEGARLYLQ